MATKSNMVEVGKTLCDLCSEKSVTVLKSGKAFCRKHASVTEKTASSDSCLKTAGEHFVDLHSKR